MVAALARTFALMPNTVLRAHRARQSQERWQAGERWQDTGFLFTSKDGRHLSRNHVEHAFHDARAKAGLPQGVTFHSRRHGYATMAKRAGVDLVAVSKALCHSTPAFTATVYQHVTPESQHEAARQMEEWLNAVLAPRNPRSAHAGGDERNKQRSYAALRGIPPPAPHRDGRRGPEARERSARCRTPRESHRL